MLQQDVHPVAARGMGRRQALGCCQVAGSQLLWRRVGMRCAGIYWHDEHISRAACVGNMPAAI
jgi:hypothetical protein